MANKPTVSDREEKILMTSIFSLRQALNSIRRSIEITPDAATALSISEEYDLLIEVVDLVLFARKAQDKVFGYRNPLIKQDPAGSTYKNVGGLIRVETQDRLQPISDREKNLFEGIRIALIRAKRGVRAGGFIPSLSVSDSVQEQRAKKLIEAYKAEAEYSYRKRR